MIKLKCYDIDGNYLFDLEVTEPLQPYVSFFHKLDKKWMCVLCDLVPINEEEAQQEIQIAEYKAVLREVEEMGVGFNDPNYTTRSKIFGRDAIRLQESRNTLKDLGIDVERIEEMGVDHTKLTKEQIQDIKQNGVDVLDNGK